METNWLWELHNPCMQKNKWKRGGNYSHCLSNSAQEVGELLHIAVPTASAGQLTPLCQTHYKHGHRLLNTEMYECMTCNAAYIKGTSRYCPNPIAIKLINVVMLISTLQMRMQYAPIVTILTLKFYICLRKSVSWLTIISKPSLRPLHL